MVTGPKLTLAQILASLIAGVPIVASLLQAFGVYSISKEEQDALTSALNWAIPFAGLLVGGDAVLRASRNHATAKIQAASLGTDDSSAADEGDAGQPTAKK